ncbi:hypothetical protein [Acetobacterium woodii]|uniref:Uncharacterized protein n=1 Tax=Acetobacterium woodii (strain ATCC 29683 / DSM 1030 / JCM 2381 / KCTC 1655 / WB1) TaxID=931626 RepID=H6LBN8_ACEWD|nr:hypothetical protein [Acetobacterium woodii]AFA50161.1 hypothetical protein Awo_c34350 [Acetobacterium woodii DSM 1030]
MSTIIYFVITWLFIFGLGKIEQRIDPKRCQRVVRRIAQPTEEIEVRA